jgi:hypothetical protein
MCFPCITFRTGMTLASEMWKGKVREYHPKRDIYERWLTCIGNWKVLYSLIRIYIETIGEELF